MDKLYSWTIRRAGAGLTIAHSCGKITNVVTVEPEQTQAGKPETRRIVATTGTGRAFELA
jgi:hypothetical protein